MPKKQSTVMTPARQRSRQRCDSVAEMGEAVAGMETFNRDKYGYTCPREHYIDGPGDLKVDAMAELWGVSPQCFFNWVRRGQWDDKRSVRMHEAAIVPAEKQVQMRLAEQQNEWRERKLVLANSILDKAMKMMEEKEEAMSAMGGLVDMKLRVKSLKDLSAVVKEQGDIINATLRVPSKAPGANDEIPDGRMAVHANFGLVAFEIAPESPRNGRPPRVIDSLPVGEDE